MVADKRSWISVLENNYIFLDRNNNRFKDFIIDAIDNKYFDVTTGERVSLALWRSKNLVDNDGVTIPIPEPCWYESLNRVDVILENVEVKSS